MSLSCIDIISEFSPTVKRKTAKFFGQAKFSRTCVPLLSSPELNATICRGVGFEPVSNLPILLREGRGTKLPRRTPALP